jgi:UDP-N-acetylmuramate: L-alanyl-gamma-D-glutamyl-meso-diaminopimelate ligase
MKTKDSLYFVGIAGTGMASVAGLCREAGYTVSGSDQEIYPPMSTMLENLGIPVFTPYGEDNLKKANPSRCVVGNSVSSKHGEVLGIEKMGIPYTSFPGILEDAILPGRFPVVITGTHGKTTTAALLTHMLLGLGLDPGYLIGGVPQKRDKSFALGTDPIFVLEGDEYDTAFFDKESKFLHYCPRIGVINNIEFDHADIFADLAQITTMFQKFAHLLPDPKDLLINGHDPLLTQLFPKATPIGTTPSTESFYVSLTSLKLHPDREGLWQGLIQSQVLGEIPLESTLTGAHNWANISQVIGVLSKLWEKKLIPDLSIKHIQDGIRSFAGVKRRLELLAEKNGIRIFEDFAHHPTAVGAVITGVRKSYPKARIRVAFEPKNASSRRNIFMEAYAREFARADEILFGVAPEDARIPGDQKMDTQKLAQMVGPKARAFPNHEELYFWLSDSLKPGDLVIFMSPGSFSGIHHRLARGLLDSPTAPLG